MDFKNNFSTYDISLWIEQGNVRESWANWGYSLNFMLFIGVMEILGAVGLLIPKLSSFAALGLSIIVIGAAFAHLRRDFSPLMPVILLGLFIVIFIIGFPKRIFKKK